MYLPRFRTKGKGIAHPSALVHSARLRYVIAWTDASDIAVFTDGLGICSITYDYYDLDHSGGGM